MGVEIKLSDRELPVSPVFIDFLYHIVAEVPFEGAVWGDQLSEALTNEQARLVRSATDNATLVLSNAVGQQAIGRAYQLLVALMTGDVELIKDIQLRFHFINIIGVPRNGGSYLTKEIYRALGFHPDRVPNVIAHDGFPEAGPFTFDRGVNSWTTSLQTMAEYLTMVELYFGKNKPHSGKIVVPKKLTKGTYAGGFFHRILGHAVENILTVRHPVTSCISTYEKSGGWPANGKFAVRGNIEEWARRDLVYTGVDPEEIANTDYFDAYLRYWEQYHYYVATTGLSASRDIIIVAYGKERMEDLVKSFYYRFGHRDPKPESFEVFDNHARHPEWFRKAEPVVKRVAEVWNTVGLRFPFEEVMEGW
ncbi:MAG: hypothetical protein HY749_04825 [Gammaproteobacteria bacterium]|nr:hypothetical protein [Gammaproteobacteria bacterium]MBI5617659.1 hypothetical protein [Gammaproteobacteria bacterium]